MPSIKQETPKNEFVNSTIGIHTDYLGKPHFTFSDHTSHHHILALMHVFKCHYDLFKDLNEWSMHDDLYDYEIFISVGDVMGKTCPKIETSFENPFEI